MRKPLVLRTPETGGGNDCEFREALRQGGAPTQVLAELCRMLADLRRADQQLEGAAEPAAPAGDDQVVDPALSRCHLAEHDFAITSHSFLLCDFSRAPAPPPLPAGGPPGGGIRASDPP